MQVRKFGKYEVSVLGLGLFGMQTLTCDIDGRAYLEALSCALSLGINYIDLGFPGFQRGDSTLIRECGKLLRGSTAVTALRVFVRPSDSAETLEASVSNVLSQYGLDRVTVLQLDGINRTSWRTLLEKNIIKRACAIADTGLCDGLTFSFTDDSHYLRPILDTGYFQGIALDYSLMDNSRNPGSFKLAADFNMGIIAHGVTKNGRLMAHIPDEVSSVWALHPERSPYDWMLSFALEKPEISCVLIEAQSARQVENCVANAQAAVRSDPDITGLLLGKKVKDLYNAKRCIQCELCRCCMPCPIGINAPRIAELYNDYLMYRNKDIPAFMYRLEHHDSRRCTKCHKCAKACPRGFGLPEIISEAERLFRFD